MRRNPYYHGSKTPLEIGAIIRPKKDGYAQRQFVDGSEDNWVERAMEAGRPPGKLSRLESVFLLRLDGDRAGDDGFLFEHAGGYGDYVYEVEPLGRIEESDLRWYTAAAYPRTELGRKRAISAYWRGKPAGYQMEYRTPAAKVVRLAGGSAVAKKNPPLGAPWLTPRLEARLRDLERRHINERTRQWGHKEGLLVCYTAPEEALPLVEMASGLEGDVTNGLILHHGYVPGGWPNADRGELNRPYGHKWIELVDGTIVDIASSQFGQQSPLVIPPRHPMQRLYIPEHPTADAFSSGYVPLLIDRRTRMKNPSTVESLRQSISDYGPRFAEKFEEFYPDSATGELRPHATEKLYKGKKVHWIGTPGHMVRVTPDYVRNLEGNVFDPEKLAAVSWFIRHSDEPVVMRPGYGQVVATTSIDDIAESLQYAKDAEIFGEDRTLSTDDEELDAYLKDPQTYLSDNLRWYDGPGSESDDEDAAKAGLRAQMEERKAEAVREGWGDLGARRFTILDGNHRSFGALLAGEPFIWIRLLENDYQDFMRGGRPDLKGVLENPAETRFDDFLHELPFFLESAEALSAINGLKTRGDNPWLGGGCFVLTEALLEFLGPSANALDITSAGLDLHSVVELGGVWIDGGGSFAPAQARRLFRGMTGTEPHERMADKRMVKRLVSALRARFGTVLLG